MAFATSEISARVGRGLTIMLSSIWVAVTMGLPKEKERSMMSFWMPGSSVKSISTPRSPRATMTASAAERMLSMLFTPSRFSILAMMRMLESYSFSRLRMSYTSCAVRTKEAAMKSKPFCTPKMMSSRSFWLR